jgi:hypothetical protein
MNHTLQSKERRLPPALPENAFPHAHTRGNAAPGRAYAGLANRLPPLRRLVRVQ